MNERVINIATILNGKKLADGVCEDLKMRVNELKKFEIQPRLTIVTSGDNEAGKVYVRNKVRRCEEIGIEAEVIHFDYLTEEDVAKKLFDEIAPKYEDRQGGYTRVVKAGYRRGDGTPMAIVELV